MRWAGNRRRYSRLSEEYPEEYPRETPSRILIITQKLLYSPFDREVPQIRVMLSNTHKQHGNVRRVDEAHERADHVPDRIALGDDEPVQGPARSECGVEVPRLSDRVCAYQGLGGVCQLEYIIFSSKIGGSGLPRQP